MINCLSAYHESLKHMNCIAGPIVSPIDVKAAVDNRDSLAKTLYSRLFDWLVDKINRSVGQDPHAVTMVGVLDIYGNYPSTNPYPFSGQIGRCPCASVSIPTPNIPIHSSKWLSMLERSMSLLLGPCNEAHAMCHTGAYSKGVCSSFLLDCCMVCAANSEVLPH